MGWCPKAEFLILYEKLALSDEHIILLHTRILLEVLNFILYGIINNKLPLLNSIVL